MEIKKCKYCNKDVVQKGKNSMTGHLVKCKKYMEWKDSTFTYDFLYDEYIVKGKSALQIANEHGYPSSAAINKQLKKLNIKVRSVKESHYTEKYKERIESTNMERFGAINPLSRGTTTFDKRNNTVKERYGVDNVFQTESVKDKIRNSNIKLYGAPSHLCKLHVNYDTYKSSILKEFGVDNPAKSDKVKLKQRLIMIKQINDRLSNGGQMTPSYNINSVPILEQKAKEIGITDLQHAENGGEYYIKELGYWVDGYSKEKNIVIEYDEKHHFNKDGKLKKKDINRQHEIENLLGCTFIRIRYED